MAWDYLSDHYYVNTQYSRVRAEISFVGSSGHELGFWTSIGTNNKSTHWFVNQSFVTANFAQADLFTFFYRRHFGNGATGRVWGGFTNYGDGIVGGDFRVPLSCCFAMVANANYLIPNTSNNNTGWDRESWALSINLAWYPVKSVFSSITSAWRPLFNVADNSTFMLHRK